MTTSPSEPRFRAAVRWFHWANALLFLTLMATASALYLDPVSRWVGRRALVRDVHVWCGVALPVLWAVAWSSPSVRADAARLNRWTADDWRWWRGGSAPVGKFNAGQKLNAAVVAGAVPVMFGTGAIMRWFEPFPLSWRTGATFVHDWVSVVVFAFSVGHIVRALTRPAALRAMVLGDAPPPPRDSWPADPGA